MKVFKFGGASVKDSAGVKNIIKVLNSVGFENTLIVVSALGKSTNTLEKIIDQYFNDRTKTPQGLLELKVFHLKIIEDLFKENQVEV